MTTQTAVEEQTAQIVALKDSVDALLASVTGITTRANDAVTNAEGIVTANADLSAAIAAANEAVAAATAAAGNVTDTVNAAATNAATAVQTDFAGQLAAAQALVEAAQAQIDALDGVGGGSGLGYDPTATLRDVTSSRVSGAVYRNSTAFMADIHGQLDALNTAKVEISADNLAWLTVATGAGNVALPFGRYTIPPQHYYRVTNAALLFEVAGALGDFVEVGGVTPPANIAPVATDDTVSVDYETPLTFDVLSNDTDADGDALTVTGATASVGSVVVNGDYTLTFTPPAGFDGAVTISYTISDGQGGTDTGSVNLTVATDPADPYAIPTRTFTFAEVDALHNTAGPLVEPTLTVGVDTLPAGVSISGDVLYIGADAVLDGWIIEGYRVVFSSGDGIMRNCRWTQDDAADYIQGFLHEADALHCQIISNRIIGNGKNGKLSSGIKQQTSGSGATATCGAFLTVKNNWFGGFPADGIKIAGRALIEGNYFDTPANLPYDPPAYDSGATYAAGDYVYDATRTYAYVSAIDANTGNALPTGKTDNASWTNVDPHADFINPFARINGRVVIRGNKLQRSNEHRLYGNGYGHGVNNGIRLNPNTGGTFGFYGAEVYNNIVAGGEDKSAYAVDFASQAQIDTITAAGSVWEADSVTDNWFGANSSGLWYSGGVPPASESGNVIYAQPAPVIPAVFAVLGQSENEIALFSRDSFYTQGPYPALLSGVDAQLVSSQQGTAPWRQIVDAAAVSGRNISPGFVAFANLWHTATGGRPLRMIDLAKPGTSMNGLLRDSTDATDDRVFADDAATLAFGIGWFGPVDRVVYNWWNAEASVSKTWWPSRCTHSFAINQDGTPADMAAADLQHSIFDVTGRGYGMFDPGHDTKFDLMLAGQEIMEPAQTLTEWTNYLYDSGGTRTSGRLYQNAEPQVSQRHYAISQFPLAHRGKATITPSVSRFGDYEGGVKLDQVQAAQTSIHPSLQHIDGQQLFAQHVCASFLVAEGYIDAPVVDRIEWATDGSYADMVVSLPTGTTLTTMRLRAAEAVASPRPHQQEVIGFVVRRVGDGLSSERPLFRSAATTYPAAYRGSAVIHDTGSDNGGAWEAIVRITPDEPFENGDQIGFGMDGGYPHCILSGSPDYDARLYRDALIAHVPAWDGAGYPGLPVQPQFAGVASNITVVVAPEPTDRLTTDGAAWFAGPSGPGAGVTKITNQATFNVAAISAAYAYLFSQSSTGNDVQLLNNRTVRVSKVEDTAGTALVSSQFVKLGGVNYVVPSGDFTITVVTNWTAHTVNVTINGIVMDVINFTTAGDGAANPTRELLVGNVPAGTYGLPAGSTIKDASILLNDVAYKSFPNDAAAANTDGWKAGTGSFS